MKIFKDAEGREWTVALTVASAKRVRDLLKVNLLELEAGDPPLITRLGTDVILICDVVYVLCKPQADGLKLTSEQFGQALGGEAILGAQTALYEELELFFRGLARTDLARAIRKQADAIRMAVERAGAMIEGIDLEQTVNAAIPGESSPSSPASRGSIQAP